MARMPLSTYTLLIYSISQQEIMLWKELVRHKVKLLRQAKAKFMLLFVEEMELYYGLCLSLAKQESI